MVLLTYSDRDTLKDVGTCYFPKKGPGFAEEYELEEYLAQEHFTYLKQKTLRFIYKDISDGDADKILHGIRADNTEVNINEVPAKDGVLYVQQGEIGITCPKDKSIQYIGSSDATTCHIVIIRDSDTGVSGVAHIDSLNQDHLNKFVGKITNLVKLRCNDKKDEPDPANESQEGKAVVPTKCDKQPLELYVVGGYQDERDMSEELSMDLMKYFIHSRQHFIVRILAIGRLNTIHVDGNDPHNAPILCGSAVELSTGKVFPANFSYRGPDETIRHLRLSFCSRKNGFVDPYNPETGELTVPSFHVNAHTENLTYYMQLPDETFLQYMSTSPKVEPPHFVENQKRIFRTAIDNPNMYKDIFPNRCDRIWMFQKGRGWLLKGERHCKIVDQEDEEKYQICDKS